VILLFGILLTIVALATTDYVTAQSLNGQATALIVRIDGGTISCPNNDQITIDSGFVIYDITTSGGRTGPNIGPPLQGFSVSSNTFGALDGGTGIVELTNGNFDLRGIIQSDFCNTASPSTYSLSGKCRDDNQMFFQSNTGITGTLSGRAACVGGSGLTQMIGRMLIQPDAMTLALAYGITNSIWMAPLAIGIGAGVYLTKSKLKKKNETP